MAHLALLPRSPASRRFVWRVILLVTCAAALAAFGLAGWHTVTNAPRDGTSLALTPAGRGWYHLAGLSAPPPFHGRAVLTDVWWNPVVGALAAVAAFVVTLPALGGLLSCQRAWAQRALGPRYRDQGRLQAAMHYGTAWLIGLLPAALLLLPVRLVEVSTVSRWAVVPPRVLFVAPAAVIAILAVAGYAFGLMRTGARVPVPVRKRVALFFALWNPLLLAGWAGVAGAAVYFGLNALMSPLGLAW